MKLPVLDTYAFPITLPSSGRTITLRPFLVREEKLLLMAQESANTEEKIEAVAQVIRNCTNGAVEPLTAPYFDIEYLLLQLRTRSVGESVSFTYECHNIRNTGSECRHRTPIKINLPDITVQGITTETPPMSIPLSERYVLNLRYPTVYTVESLLSATIADSPNNQSDAINKLVDVFDTLLDTNSNTLYRFDEYNEAEKIEFLNALMPTDYEKITQFVATMPTLKYTLEYTCIACEFTHRLQLSGLSDFLV